MRLLIAIVNYKSAALTLDCLQSLQPEVAAVPGETRVVVVENASGDNSAQVIGQAIDDHDWGPWVTLRELDHNGGFAAGNNAALAPALQSGDPPDHVLLLNPDTLVRPGALTQLLDFMDAHPQVGIAGSRLEGPDGTPQCSAFRFHSPLSEFEGKLRLGVVSRLLAGHIVALPVGDEPHRADWVSGASMLIRRAVLEQVGLMDEGYFLYFEETDLCWRAAQAGWSTWYVPTSRVTHLVSQSTGITAPGQRPPRRPGYWFESRRRFFLKNQGLVKLSAADAAAITGLLGWKLKLLVTRRLNPDPPRLLGDLIRHAFLNPSAGPGPAVETGSAGDVASESKSQPGGP